MIYIDKVVRIFISFILFVLKWGLPLLVVIAVIFVSTSILISLIPKNLTQNEFFTTVITGIVSFTTLKFVEGYIYILKIKKQHLKRIVITLAELNKIKNVMARSSKLLDMKIKKLKEFKGNIDKSHLHFQEPEKYEQVKYFGSLYTNQFEKFLNVSEESKTEILNVDVINSLESFILRTDSNNYNISILNDMTNVFKDKSDHFLELYRAEKLANWNFEKMKLELDNFIEIHNNLREELNRTYASLIVLFTKLGISEVEDRISFDIWLIMQYTSDFNREYGRDLIKEELEERIIPQMKIKDKVEDILKKYDDL